MTKVGKVVKSVAGTALRAAAAAAATVVLDKMADAVAERVQEMAEAQAGPRVIVRRKAGGAAKVKVQSGTVTNSTPKAGAGRAKNKKKSARRKAARKTA